MQNVTEVENHDVRTQFWKLPKLSLSFYLKTQSSDQTSQIAHALVGLSFPRKKINIETLKIESQFW
jgi:hypothetical protein